MIEAIEAITKKADLKLVEDNMSKLSDMLFDLSVELGKKAGQQDAKGIEKSVKALEKELKSQQKKIKGYEAAIKALGEKQLNFDDTNITKRLTELSKEMSAIDLDLRNDRTSRMIMDLENLTKVVDDFKAYFVRAMPEETRERIKNEDEGTDSG